MSNKVFIANVRSFFEHALYMYHIQSDTKQRELLKNPTKIEEIQEKKILTEIEPLQLAFLETVIQIINV